MARDDLLDDDILRRVAAARPHVDDDDLAADGVRATAIAERVLRTPRTSDPARPDQVTPPARSRRHRPRVGGLTRIRLLGTLGAAGLATAAALVIAGIFSGPGDTGTQPARADVFTLTADAMTGGPGTVVVQRFETTQGRRHPTRNAQTIVDLTPAGPGPEQILNAGYLIGKVSGTAVLGPDAQVYTPSTNTIYVSSIWGPYIHRTRSGGYVYREGPGSFLNGLRSLPLTRAQAEGLRAGTLQIEVNAQQKWHVGPVQRAPSVTQMTVQLLREHAYRYDGRTTLNGRTVDEFGGPRWDPSAVGSKRDPHDIGGIVLYVDPTTHLPVEQTVSRGSDYTKQVWTDYKVLPITASTRKLVTLQSLHPTAKVVRNHAAYVKASRGVAVFSGF